MAATAPEGSHKPVNYPAAVLKTTQNEQAAKDFLAYLKGDECAKGIYRYRLSGAGAQVKLGFDALRCDCFPVGLPFRPNRAERALFSIGGLMDWFPLLNSLRVALIATVLTFLLGIWAANGVTRLPAWLKGAVDTVLTLPLVLPPTVVGFFLLKTISPKAALGAFFLDTFGWKLTMTWYSAIFATTIVAFPLMYRTARGSFEQLSPEWEACAETMGLSRSFIFWRIKLPNCKAGLLAGTVLSFARGVGRVWRNLHGHGATFPAKRRRLRPRCTSFGGKETMRWLTAGC